MTLAKGLGGGLPVGACLCASRLGEVMGPSSHGSTFGGNPVVCAAGRYMLTRLTDADFLAGVARKGEAFRPSAGRHAPCGGGTGAGHDAGSGADKGTAGKRRKSAWKTGC